MSPPLDLPSPLVRPKLVTGRALSVLHHEISKACYKSPRDNVHVIAVLSCDLARNGYGSRRSATTSSFVASPQSRESKLSFAVAAEGPTAIQSCKKSTFPKKHLDYGAKMKDCRSQDRGVSYTLYPSTPFFLHVPFVRQMILPPDIPVLVSFLAVEDKGDSVRHQL
jgi:hypothetical protein